MAEAKLTVERLRELMHYNPETGTFTRRIRSGPTGPAGAIAGSMYNNGYRVICIARKDYGAHRLAWLYMTGEWPRNNIDHINCDRADNRFANLRDVPQSHNSQNQRRPHRDKKSCQLLGATWDKMWGNWKAQLVHKKKTIYLGRFKTAEEAHAAYLEGKRRIHPGCTI